MGAPPPPADAPRARPRLTRPLLRKYGPLSGSSQHNEWRAQMKKLINEPDAVVREALEGIEAAHADHVRVTYDPYVIVRADAPKQGKVAIISGGGSGHEPMHG